MARRSGRTSTTNSVRLPTPEQSRPLPQSTCLNENLATLRTQWKWAAFSQFMTTFSALLNMADVTVTVRLQSSSSLLLCRGLFDLGR